MDFKDAVLLGLIQGLTEFLPISSSGHLVLAQAFCRIEAGLAFDAFIHLGTLGAVLFYFRKDWRMFLRSFGSPGWGRRLFFMLIIGTIPGALAGLFLEDWIATYFRSPSSVAFMLAVMSLPLLLGEIRGKKKKSLEELGLFGAFLIGWAQTLALLPGTSRSGITMATGLLLGLSRTESAHFSFLLSAPIIAGAGLFEGLKLFTLQAIPFSLALVGALAAFLSGWLAISFLLRFLQSHTFYPFIIYRLMLALGVYALF